MKKEEIENIEIKEIPNIKLRNVVHSSYLDVLAVAIIVITSFALDYQKTFYVNNKLVFNLPYNQWISVLMKNGIPLGIISILVACFSMISARLICKQKNLGNAIGIFTVIFVAVIDYVLGNKSAIITYPFSFLLAIFGTVKWKLGGKIRQKDSLYYGITIISLALGYWLTYLGFNLFDNTNNWYNGTKAVFTFHAIALTFGLSLAANTAVAFKYQETWINWLLYDVIQIIKNALIQNWANVGKYVFYIINVCITYFDWKINKDI